MSSADLTRAIRNHDKEYVYQHRFALTATQAKLLAGWPKSHLTHVFRNDPFVSGLFEFVHSEWKLVLPVLLTRTISTAATLALSFDALDRLSAKHQLYASPSWIWDSLFLEDLQRKQRALVLPLSSDVQPLFYLSSLLKKKADSWWMIDYQIFARLVPWMIVSSFDNTRRNLCSYDVMTYLQSNPKLLELVRSLPLMVDLSEHSHLTEQQYAAIDEWIRSRPDRQSIEPNSWLQHFYSPVDDPEMLLQL